MLPSAAPPLKAITLHRPWAHAVAHLGKDYENRSWGCPLPPGSLIAIHAGKKFDPAAADWIRRTLGQDCSPDQPTGIVAIAKFGGNVRAADSPWFVGPIGWRLTDVVAFPSIPCRGQQGLWRVPDETLLSVLAAYAMAPFEPPQTETRHV